MKILRTIPEKGWRQGQTIFNFLAWLQDEKGHSGNQNRRLADTFHIGDKDLENLYEEYTHKIKGNKNVRFNDK